MRVSTPQLSSPQQTASRRTSASRPKAGDAFAREEAAVKTLPVTPNAPLPPTPSQARARTAREQAAPLVQAYLASTCAHTCASLMSALSALTGKAVGAVDDAVFADIYAFTEHCLDTGDLVGARDAISVLATACHERGKVGSPFAQPIDALLKQHAWSPLETALMARDFEAAAPWLALFDAAAGDRDKKFIAEEYPLIDALSDALREHVWTPLSSRLDAPALNADDVAHVKDALRVLSGAGEAGRVLSPQLFERLVRHLQQGAHVKGARPMDLVAAAMCEALGAMWLSRADEPRPIVLAHPASGSPLYSLSVRRDDYDPTCAELVLHTPTAVLYL